MRERAAKHGFVVDDPTATVGKTDYEVAIDDAARSYAMLSRRGVVSSEARRLLASGRYAEAIEKMKAPAGYKADRELEGVWRLMDATGTVVSYWTPELGYKTPTQFEGFMGEFRSRKKIMKSGADEETLSQFADEVLTKGVKPFDRVWALALLRRELRYLCHSAADKETAISNAVDNAITALGERSELRMERLINSEGVEWLFAEAAGLWDDALEAAKAREDEKPAAVAPDDPMAVTRFPV